LTVTAQGSTTPGPTTPETEWGHIEPKSWHVAVRDTQLRVLEWGDPASPPILLVHGMRAHAHWFAPVAPALVDRFRVLSVDLRGHGHSDQTPPYGHLVFGEDVTALIETLDLRDLVLLGHSMGGGVALRSALKIQERLRALVLVDSNVGARMMPPPWYGEGQDLANLTPEQIAMLRRARGPRASEMKVYTSREEALGRFRLLPGDTVVSPTLLRYLAEHAIREIPDGGFTWRFAPDMQGEMPRPLEPEQTAHIECPVLLVYGELSPIAKRVSAERALEYFVGARSRAVEHVRGAHHHVFLDRPQDFNRMLSRHLDELGATAHFVSGRSSAS